MNLLRYGPITFVDCQHALPAAYGPPRLSEGRCPACTRKLAKPKRIISTRRPEPSRLTPRPLRYDARPKGVPIGSERLVRQRKTPDHLFVCDACYAAYRALRPTIASHTACTERLFLRRSQMPLNA